MAAHWKSFNAWRHAEFFGNTGAISLNAPSLGFTGYFRGYLEILHDVDPGLADGRHLGNSNEAAAEARVNRRNDFALVDVKRFQDRSSPHWDWKICLL